MCVVCRFYIFFTIMSASFYIELAVFFAQQLYYINLLPTILSLFMILGIFCTQFTQVLTKVALDDIIRVNLTSVIL